MRKSRETIPDVDAGFAGVTAHAWHVRVDLHGTLVLEKVPILHEGLNRQAFLKSLPDHIVCLNNLLQCNKHLIRFSVFELSVSMILPLKMRGALLLPQCT